MTESCKLQRRPTHAGRALSLMTTTPGLSELEARLLASRGAAPAKFDLPRLLATPLIDLPAGAARVATAIQKKEHIVVIGDYDCDGATSCAVAVAGLRALGAQVSYVVPDRMIHGYGISASIVDLTRDRYPDARVLITVDNGIMGHAGIAHAARLDMDVVVTDHHLPGMSLPDAWAVIDPSRGDCNSGLDKLAGVGVALFLVVQVKQQLAAAGTPGPSLGFLLPYVAIGTVADMVSLDESNRMLVSLGLAQMRAGNAPLGVKALINEAGKRADLLTTQDIGFALGPRINAAGRLQSMETGIELLLATNAAHANKLAKLLTETNIERKRLQKEATDDAAVALDFTFNPNMRAIVQGSDQWHPGIIGLVASRIKDQHFRPTFIFSLVDGMAKGSGRSIPGFHLKDALEEIARQFPGLLSKFGGHAMAAGVTLTGPDALEPFGDALAMIARKRITTDMLNNVLFSDGGMPDLELDSAAKLLRHPWGQQFESPAFDDSAIIDRVLPLGKTGLHWTIYARVGGRSTMTKIALFNHPEPITGQEVHVYLKPDLNTYKDNTSLQWIGTII